MFIPMPCLRHRRKKFEWCFYHPKVVRGELRSLILFVLVDSGSKQNIAFRIERPGKGRHEYTHVQLTHNLAKSGFYDAAEHSGLPCWLPDSYPAFPISANCSSELFLAMMTAVHGHIGGADVLLRNMYEDDYVHAGEQHIATLNRMLCTFT